MSISSNSFPNKESPKRNESDSSSQNKIEEENHISKESSISKNTEINIMENLDIQKIKELNSKCVEFIFEEKSDISLEILKKLEMFLESNILETKFNFDKKLIIIILHNLACCYQKLKDYDNCIIYLDGVIYHFDKELEKKHQIKITEEYFYQNFNKDQTNYSLLGDLILELRFSAKFHLQMCAVLSQANRHLEALKHAKLAGLICEDNLIKTYYLFIQMKLKNIFSLENKNLNNNNVQNNKDNKEEENDFNNAEKMKLTQNIINDLFNKITNLRKNYCNNEKNINNIKENTCFNSYLKYRKNEIHKYQKNGTLLNNIRNVFGAEIKKDDWIQLLNIGNIMYLSPLNDEDIILESDPKYELLRDAILEKVVMLTVSYFCIAMEMKQLSPEPNNKKINGEYFHYQAVYFSDLYLPVSCPIVKHYINSYYKYYEKDLDVVPEGKIIDYKIDLIRNEIEINKDIQSFVRMQKINYSNNNNNNNFVNKCNNINIKMKDFNIVNSSNNDNVNNENTIGIKKTKIPLGLKLNLNLDNILNKNNNNIDINNNNSKNKKLSSSNDTKHAHNSKNKKLSSSNDNKHAHNSKNKKLSSSNDNKRIHNSNNKNEKLKKNDNYEIFPNKININIAEKSKIKELPKFKLNFNKLNNSNEENKSKEKNIPNNNSNRNKKITKKTQNKISIHNNPKIHSASINKLKKNNFKKNKGCKTERPNSNKRPININETLIMNKNEKGLDIRKSSFIKSYYNRHLSKTSRYQNKKSPIHDNKKIKGNLTDRGVANKSKSLKKSNDKKNKNPKSYYKNNIGYLTQRELTLFKLKEKANLNIDINSKKVNQNKNKNNTSLHQINKKIKATNVINANKCINKLNDKIKNNKGNNTNVIKNRKSPKIKVKENLNKNVGINNNNNNLIRKFYKNLFLIELKDNSNYIYNNYGNTVEYSKYGGNPDQIHNFNSLIKLKNPFKN